MAGFREALYRGSAGNDVFVVGVDGIFHFDGSTWESMLVTDRPLSAIWGASGTDVFAAGYGLILHYDGHAWSPMATDGVDGAWGVRAIWGTSGTDVFAVGDRGTILHYDGAAWSRMASGTTWDLTDTWGTDSDHLYAVGTDAVGMHGLVMYYDGTTWSRMNNAPGSWPLYGVWGTPTGEIFAAGGINQYGCCAVVLSYNGAWWTEQVGSEHGVVEAGSGQYWSNMRLHDVWGVEGHVFAVGSGILRGRP